MRKAIAMILALLLALSMLAALADTEYTDKDTVKAVQQALNDAGFDCGTPDGVAGKNTKNAISGYQAANGLEQTGTINDALLEALGLADSEAEETAASEEVEITFQGVPWGTHPEDLIGLLRQAGFYPPENNGVDTVKEIDSIFHQPEYLQQGGQLLLADSEVMYLPDYAQDYEAVLRSRSVYQGFDESQIAGYDLMQWTPTFIVEGDALSLVNVKIEFDLDDADAKAAAYEDLSAKLTAVYGEGEHLTGWAGSLMADVWQGANDTAVVLFALAPGGTVENLQLCYGKTDAEARAAEALGQLPAQDTSVDPSDTSGL